MMMEVIEEANYLKIDRAKVLQFSTGNISHILGHK
jgi:hypothetical protein